VVAQEGTLKPGEIIALSEKLTLGRRKTNDVRIKDAQASLNHAVIERRGDGYWLVDQGSENGTFLNEKKIAEATRLKDGDLIQIAKVIYRVQKS
jgi:pSer/pThr/pTyr-binding forkhead associated (FHA) protein